MTRFFIMDKKELFYLSIEDKSKFWIPSIALVIAAHPDDAEIFAGGLTLALIENKAEIHYLVCTNGDAGSWNKAVTSHQLTETRKREQLEAAAALGVLSVSFLGISDGDVRAADKYLKQGITRTIRSLKPQMVITHDPWKRYDLNDDHRVVGFAAAHATLLASNSLYLPDQAGEGLGTHFTRLITFFNTDNPNLWVDISDYFVKKEAAVKLHRSQFKNRTSFFLELKRKAEAEGKEINKPYAEAHHLVLNS